LRFHLIQQDLLDLSAGDPQRGEVVEFLATVKKPGELLAAVVRHRNLIVIVAPRPKLIEYPDVLYDPQSIGSK
jgi:hypothetical protein